MLFDDVKEEEVEEDVIVATAEMVCGRFDVGVDGRSSTDRTRGERGTGLAAFSSCWWCAIESPVSSRLSDMLLLNFGDSSGNGEAAVERGNVESEELCPVEISFETTGRSRAIVCLDVSSSRAARPKPCFSDGRASFEMSTRSFSLTFDAVSEGPEAVCSSEAGTVIVGLKPKMSLDILEVLVASKLAFYFEC